MIPGLKRELESAVSEACRRLFGVEAPRIVLETPPKVELGDLACPVAFELAKVLKRPPRKIAEELAPALTLPALVVKRSVEGGGYLNFFLDRPRTLRAMLIAPSAAPAVPAGADKLIVEHTNINPNKAAHIGHLRNAVLGDVLVSTFKRLGRRVEIQNYLDDTGVQVADVVVALQNAADLVESSRAKRLGEEIREILDAFPVSRAGRRAAPAGRPRMGPLRARGEELRGRSVPRREAACHASRHRGRRHGR